ncbi:hypothetical protein JCM3766R1_000203 [Sporobolomyces carnicolor]
MPPKTDADRAAHELVLKPEMLMGTPTFWWIGLVTEAFLAACVAVNIVDFSVAFTWQKKIELGDILIIRAHDAEMMSRIYGDAIDDISAGNDVASKLMWLSWDLMNASTFSMITNTLTDKKIENMHGFSDLPKEVQDRILQESVHMLETGRIAALGKNEQVRVTLSKPDAEQDRALDALRNVQDSEYRRALIWTDEYDPDCYGLVRGPRALTEKVFIEKMETANGDQNMWETGVLKPTESSRLIAVHRARLVLDVLALFGAPVVEAGATESTSRKRVRDRDIMEVCDVVKRNKTKA